VWGTLVVLRKLKGEVPKKLNNELSRSSNGLPGRVIRPIRKIREALSARIDGCLPALQRAGDHTNNGVLKSNALLPSKSHFKISFASRRCCNVREHVATGWAFREKRLRYVQCKIERFGQVERLERFCPGFPVDRRSFVLC
jgi:hypothetical protein